MLRYFFVVVLVGVVSTAPQNRQNPNNYLRIPGLQQRQRTINNPITSYSLVRDDAGQFSLQFQDRLGTLVSERGLLKPGQEGHVLVKSGSYSYTSPEGVPIQVSYEADEGGFRPTGDSIPVGSVPTPVQRH